MVANRNDMEGKILSELQALPDEALDEVMQFLDYQRYKAERREPARETP